MTLLRHLTWRGRLSWFYYPVRRLVVAPAPTLDRCIIGGTVDPRVWCPRRSGPDLVCPHHARPDRRPSR